MNCILLILCSVMAAQCGLPSIYTWHSDAFAKTRDHSTANCPCGLMLSQLTSRTLMKMLVKFG